MSKLTKIFLFFVIININCSIYVITKEITKEENFTHEIDLSRPIDTLDYLKITNAAIQKKASDLVYIIETYFKKDSILMGQKTYLNNLLQQIPRKIKKRTFCILPYYYISLAVCEIGSMAFGVIISGLIVPTNEYIWPLITLPLIIISDLGNAILIKKWYDKLVVDIDDVKKINEIVVNVNYKIKG